MMRTTSRPYAVVGNTGPRSVAMGALLLCLALVFTLGFEVQASSVITHGSRAKPWVALTFDDGWSADRCAQIVRTLRAKKATATFLINGSIIRSSPARWRSMLAGFPVANHTLTHPWLDRLGAAQIRSQIRTNEQVIERALGRSMLHLLRPPYGAYDSEVIRVADSLGYRTILWDTSGVDTSSAATTSSVIRNATRGGNGAIVLLHCGPSVTPAAVGPIIDNYRSRGYRLVDLGTMLGLAPSPRACRVKNLSTGVTKGSLRKAAKAASPGDRLTLRGICRGTTTLGKDLTIRGTHTRTSGPPALSGMDRGTVVTVAAGTAVKIVGLTIRGGAAKHGGGIVNAGDLRLRDVIVRGNRATAVGGGIINRGSLIITGSSSIRGNTSLDRAGGIRNMGTLKLAGDSSIKRNTASSSAGGLMNSGALFGVLCGDNVHDNAPDDCVES